MSVGPCPRAEGPTITDIDLSGRAAELDGSRPLRGYLASPAGTGPWPAVVMIHEIFGLDDRHDPRARPRIRRHPRRPGLPG